MTPQALNKKREKQIDALVQEFLAHRDFFSRLETGLISMAQSAVLAPYVHSVKSRIKEPEHLRDKLRRKMRSSIEDGSEFGITKDNLFSEINDLAGIRILHLHTRQFENIHLHLMSLLDDGMYNVNEVFARTWDDESRQYFESVGVPTQASGETMYTSVHYVIQPNTRTPRTAEIQVRTLAEELWGEVNHSINYPHPSSLMSCREQIKVLARVTSSCSRLVDSIFMTNSDSAS